MRATPGSCSDGRVLRSLRACVRLALVVLLSLSFASRASATTARGYRLIADQAAASGHYAQAVAAYRSEAAIYRQKGDVEAARVEEGKADRWTTEITLYTQAPAPSNPGLPLYSAQKLEPASGCYLGGYAEADDSLSDTGQEDTGYSTREVALGQRIGKRLATAFTYSHYGEPFPSNWAHALLAAGIAPQIALEPNDGLDAVQDNDYLEQYARSAAECDGPVFLRFAAEMNGDWTNYHDNPALYRLKFKLVHDVMQKVAPNVAMIWCVNSIPVESIPDYYPGDDCVDWVGVNFYSVLHHDNKMDRPADFEHPADMLRFVYDRYSARKPIAICEFGASHRELLAPNLDRSDAACAAIAELYAAIPRQFPRVKLIDIFDCDNLRHARAGRQFNDYCITDSDTVLATFRLAVAPAYYLTSVVQGAQANPADIYVPLSDGMIVSRNATLSACVKTYSRPFSLVYRINGKEIGRANGPGPCEALAPDDLAPGKIQIEAQALDSHETPAGEELLAVDGAPVPSAPNNRLASENQNQAPPIPVGGTNSGSIRTQVSPVAEDPSIMIFGGVGVAFVLGSTLFVLLSIRRRLRKG